jgi:hypothetical protein
VVNELCDVYIDQALQLSPEELASKTKSDNGYTFLHELALFTRDRTVLRDQLIAVLLAGRDTTAATLSVSDTQDCHPILEAGHNPQTLADFSHMTATDKEFVIVDILRTRTPPGSSTQAAR